MKRFFCFLFILVLLPVVSFASFDESDVIGCWVSLDNDYSESNFVRMFVFYDNHIAYCTIQNFFFYSHLDKNPVTQSFSKWEYKGGCIFMTDVDTGKESMMYLLDDNCISYTQQKSGNLFHKVKDYKISDLPSSADAEKQDPIIGAWYIMLDYRDGPQTAETIGKTYMLYVLVFEESGAISAVSGESTDITGLTAAGSRVGQWVNENGKYTLSIVGIGTTPAEFSGDRLLVKVTTNIWYSMQRMNLGGWYTDMVLRY